jgi:four helix bundle protein
MKLEEFGALIKANALFEHVVNDMKKMHDHIGCRRLIDQQIASADSIAANIEEGYGRSSPKEYAQVLLYSRGSAQETRGRYGRMKHWLPEKDILVR